MNTNQFFLTLRAFCVLPTLALSIALSLPTKAEAIGPGRCEQVLWTPKLAVSAPHNYGAQARDFISDNGFPEPGFFELFTKDSNNFQHNLDAWTPRLRVLTEGLHQHQINEFAWRLEKASSTFQRYLNESVNTQLMILKIAIQGRLGVADWTNHITSHDSLKEDLQKVATFIKVWNPQLIEVANKNLMAGMFRARKVYASSTGPLGYDSYLPPRRAITYSLKFLNSWPRQIIEEIETGVPVAVAYKKFIQKTNRVAKLAGEGYGQFSSELILSTARVIQKSLIVLAAKQNLNLEQQKDFSVAIDGSFVNGLALANSSDIDLYFSNPGLDHFIEKSDLQRSLSELFKSYGLEDLSLEIQDVASLLPPQVRGRPEMAMKMAEIGVTSLLITPHEIKIFVYPKNQQDVKSFTL